MNIVWETLLAVFALPFVQLYWLKRYVKLKDTLAAKMGTALTFVPILIFTTLLWGGAWMLLLNSLL
jgi:hypothetical protein